MKIRLSAPTKRVFWISVVIVALALIGRVFEIPLVTENPLWFLGVGYGLLFLGSVLKGF